MKLRAAQIMTLALAVSLAGPAAAISVDDMVAWSAPGKPLRMDVGLTDLGAARASDIRVQVASASEHARFGLTRPDWADSVSFRIVTSGDKVVARATSGAPVDGDAVNFLVEIQALGQGRLQQVASSLSGSASPLVPASAPTASAPRPRPAPEVERPRPVVEKPAAKPVAKPAPVVEKTVSKPAPAPVAEKPAPAPAAAPVAAAEPIEIMPSAQAPVSPTVNPATAGEEGGAVGGGHDSLEAINQERGVVQLQLQDAQAMVSQFEQRLKELDERQAVLEGGAPVAADAPVETEAEAEAVADVPAPGESNGTGAAAYDTFNNVMIALIVLILGTVFGIEHLRAKRRK